MNPSVIEIVGVAIFAIALVHTFSTKFFEHLAYVRPAHAGIFHLLGEVEVVFGFWALVLILIIMIVQGRSDATAYIDTQNFTEPMFVFAIMVVAGSKPILQIAMLSVRIVTRFIPIKDTVGFYFVTLTLIPLLGSFITEPAAMTLAALVLRDRYYSRSISNKLKYVTLGVLFVNVSIGGVLTPYAAPPVLMVASKWNWDLWFMLAHFGWKSILAVLINAVCATLLFRRELSQLESKDKKSESIEWVPLPMMLIHLFFLVAIVIFAHHPAIFMGLLLFFLGFAHAYQRYQDRLILREGLLVAFFLAGLVVLGGQQKWWLQPLLQGMDINTVYFGAVLLTAITDNAALTYLGSLVEGLAPAFKYALVSGAVTGGGLTVIANAPNPAGFSILRSHFNDGAIHPIGLLLAAIPPTLVTILIFRLL